MFAEEAYLCRKFGTAYLLWTRVTPAFVPKLNSYRKAALPFSVRTVLRREYNGFFAVIVAMFGLEVGGDLSAQGRFDCDVGWIVGVGVSFLLWLVLRAVKKYTRLLYVEGR